jgi:signal transduction histidine kinase
MRLAPKSHAGQLAFLLFIALFVAQAIAFVIFAGERARAARFAYQENILARTATLVQLLGETETAVQGQLLDAASTRQVRFSRTGEPIAEDGRDRMAAFLARELAESLGIGLQDVRVSVERDEAAMPWWQMHGPWAEERHERFGEHGRHMRRHPITWINLSVRLGNGDWLNVVASPPPAPPPFGSAFLVSLALSVVAAGLVAFLLGQRIAQPLRQLARSAEAFGRGEAVAPLAERGPDEVRRTASAFNEMRERLDRFVSDRSAMLAAISHDLRTPITSLRLRAELVDDAEIRDRLIETIAEMQAMTEGVLAFLRAEATHEETRATDITALADSVVSDLEELGHDVTMASSASHVARCRTGELRRAVRNMVENAARYGDRARVLVDADDAFVRIVIEDNGPGIPDGDLQRVFDPFVRLETSRSRETGGIGLGLAIARSIMRGHGGDAILENRAEGGLRAVLSLPAGHRAT